MIKNIFIIGTLLISSCTSLPKHMPDSRIADVVVHVYADSHDIKLAHPYFASIRGFKQTINGKCHVHYVVGDYEALSHEIAHCFYGSFHD